MAVLQRHKSTVYGLVSDLATINQDIASEAQARIDSIGDLSTLTTTGKGSTVEAINELDTDLGTAETAISDLNTLTGSVTLTTDAQSITEALNELDTNTDNNTAAIDALDSVTLKKSDNLSDLADKATARTNLDVFSKSEVQTEIDNAGLNLGTNFSATDASDADSKFGADSLTVNDNIYLIDDGDGKWAIYKVTATNDGSYSDSTLEKIMDEDAYLNSQSAEAIKSAYESNADTNAYIDADKAKVDFVSVTAAIDLDKVIQNDELIIDTGLAGASDTNIASTTAVKTYIDNQDTLDLKIANDLSDLHDVPTARTNLDVYSKAEVDNTVNSGGAVFTSESLTVSSDKITLSYAPKNGIVFNFATVRYIDDNSVAYDIPVTVTSTEGGKEYLLHPDASGDYDGKDVNIQYAYVS